MTTSVKSIDMENVIGTEIGKKRRGGYGRS